MQTRPVTGLVINVPDWFNDPAMVAWLNDPETRVMSWHQQGTPPDEWSDTIVLVDPGLSGEGTDSDMPAHLWDAIVQACRDAKLDGQHEHIPVRLTNIEE